MVAEKWWSRRYVVFFLSLSYSCRRGLWAHSCGCCRSGLEDNSCTHDAILSTCDLILWRDVAVSLFFLSGDFTQTSLCFREVFFVSPLNPRGENNSLWVDFTLFCVGGWMIGTVGQEANDPREASILLPGSGSLRSHYIITTARRCSVHDCKRTPHTSNFCNCVPIVLMDTKFYIPFTHTRDPVGAPSNVGHANHIYIIEYYVSYRTYLGLV